MAKFFLIEDINPQPWAVGPLGIGRKGGMYPYMAPNQQLVTFQNAIKAELLNLEPDLLDGDVMLTFYIWRSLDVAEMVSGGAKNRQRRAHAADATNIQKAIEDALQGVVFANDRQVRDVRTVLVEQGQNVRPRILIKIDQWIGLNPNELPDFIWSAIDKEPTLIEADNSWGVGEEAF